MIQLLPKLGTSLEALATCVNLNLRKLNLGMVEGNGRSGERIAHNTFTLDAIGG
jgi:hypothetical protein